MPIVTTLEPSVHGTETGGRHDWIEISAAVARYDRADDIEKEKILDHITDDDEFDPKAVLLFLNSGRPEAQPGTEPNLLLSAYCLFVQDRVPEALAICSGILNAGIERSFLLDVVTRCLVETEAYESARNVILQRQHLVRGRIELIGRFAALSFLAGDTGSAEKAAGLIRSLYPEAVNTEISRSVEKFQSYINGKYEYRDDFDVYISEKSQIDSWDKYEREMSGDFTRFSNDSTYYNGLVSRYVSRLLADHPEIENVVNYGSCFGQLEIDLASAFQRLNIMGYDRSSVATVRNRRRFKARNLTYADGDFVQAFGENITSGQSVLLHTRVGALMQPNQLANFYQQCRQLGIEWILMVEGLNFSEMTGAYPIFDGRGHPTVLEGGRLMLHDYNYYLGKAGYSIVGRELRPITYHFRRNRFKEASTITQMIVARLVEEESALQ